MDHYRDYSDDELLDALDKERGKFAEWNETVMQDMIAELIYREVYPPVTVPGNPNDIWAMVKGWGARWHTWREPLACPHCGADLRDHRTGPPFKRELAEYSVELDRTMRVICPECKVDLRAGPTAWARVLDEKGP